MSVWAAIEHDTGGVPGVVLTHSSVFAGVSPGDVLLAQDAGRLVRCVIDGVVPAGERELFRLASDGGTWLPEIVDAVEVSYGAPVPARLAIAQELHVVYGAPAYGRLSDDQWADVDGLF